MKAKYFHILLFVIGLMCFNSVSYSQNISFLQMKNLKGKNVNEAKRFLETNGWVNTNANIGGLEVFAYNQVNEKGADSFVSLCVDNSPEFVSRIKIEIKEGNYSQVFNDMLADGFVLLKSTENESKVSFYKKDNEVIRIDSFVSSSSDKKSSYFLTFMSQEEYDR